MKQTRQVFVLLPDKQHLDITVTVQARGRDVLQAVLERLDVVDLEIFGLAVLKDNEYLFVDSTQRLGKYFGKRWSKRTPKVPFILFLRPLYYLENGLLIRSRKVLQLYFAELRQKVLHSDSSQQEVHFIWLAACALQAEVGDLETRDEGASEDRCYFLPRDYFPVWLIKHRGSEALLQHASMLHAELQGVTRRDAVLGFIKRACHLRDVPLTLYRMRQDKMSLKRLVVLGVAMTGVQICENVEEKPSVLYRLSWTEIDCITFQGCRVELHAVGSLRLPKLQYHAPTAFHSRHILKHLIDTHRIHIRTRDVSGFIKHLDDTQVDRTLTWSEEVEHSADADDAKEEKVVEKEEQFGCEQCVDEPEEIFVDDPSELSWLAELLQDGCANRQFPLPYTNASFAAVAKEMKWEKANESE